MLWRCQAHAGIFAEQDSLGKADSPAAGGLLLSGLRCPGRTELQAHVQRTRDGLA